MIMVTIQLMVVTISRRERAQPASTRTRAGAGRAGPTASSAWTLRASASPAMRVSLLTGTATLVRRMMALVAMTTVMIRGGSLCALMVNMCIQITTVLRVLQGVPSVRIRLVSAQSVNLLTVWTRLALAPKFQLNALKVNISLITDASPVDLTVKVAKTSTVNATNVPKDSP